MELSEITTQELIDLYQILTANMAETMLTIQPQIDEIEAVAKALKLRAIKEEQSTTHQNVTIQYVSGYPKFTWDTKALNEYAKTNTAIEQFNRVTFVSPTAKIIMRPQ